MCLVPVSANMLFVSSRGSRPVYRLRHMRDPEDCGPDGITIEDRMQPLIERIARSIQECGSACDAYMKKSFLCKSSLGLTLMLVDDR